MSYFIFNDNGAALWFDEIPAASEKEAMARAETIFGRLTPEEREKRKSFLLCEGYYAGEICGGFYDDQDSDEGWIIEKEIADYLAGREKP